MAKDVIMPVLGMNQDTAVLLNWLKQEGEQVHEGEPIMEVETDKATMELDAPASGTLARVTAAAGDEVKVGSVIAVILAEGEAADTSARSPKPDAATPDAATPERAPAGTPRPGANGPLEPGTGAPTTGAPTTGAPTTTRTPAMAGTQRTSPSAASDRPGPYRLTPASPKARRLASERGLDVTVLEGSGPEGAVLAADVLREAERGIRPSPTSAGVPRAPGSWTEFVREVDAAPLLAVVAWAQSRTPTGGAGETAGVDVGDLLARFLAAVWARNPLVETHAGTPHGLRYRRVADGTLSDAHLEDAASAGLTAVVSAREAAAARDAGPAETGSVPALSLLDLTRARTELSGESAPHEGVVSLVAGRLAERVLAVNGAPEVRTALTLRLAFDRSRVELGAAAAWADRLLELVEDPSALALLY